ncbi:AAA family ATPase [Candidatus Woesearchaeota archaeon]|nr:AAA family ATPase [Candidatus Woesearchaeota archaeon]
MIIAVTGTPGTGKTKLSKRIAKQISGIYVDVTKLAKEQHLDAGYDKKRKCAIVDVKQVGRYLLAHYPHGRSTIIIDSHLSHDLPKSYVDLCIITTCDLKELHRRLLRRRYGKEKIRENLDAEIFQLCKTEAIWNGHKTIVVDTTEKVDVKGLVKRIKETFPSQSI